MQAYSVTADPDGLLPLRARQARSEFATGGHYAALQAPELLVDDIRTFFSAL
ncbi:hypothetical protein [Nonomuraea turkmeniaca]|uniref:hypothetical protein n=1 Tax=Nonomuraea turkmeniaca TaxID=103838 RepID=UPI001476F12A|nr:hypothetical protein [Nonomuraea turkmeniaca]